MMTFMNKLRVLPVTIFMAVFLLTIKINAIWEGVGDWMDGVSVTKAGAQQDQTQSLPKGAREILQDRHPAPPKVMELAQADMEGLTEEEKAAMAQEDAAIAEEEAAAESSSDMGDAVIGGDPTFYTQAEVDLLQKLAERREEIEAQARELDVRENLLKAAEGRIEKKVQSLKALQRTIEEQMVKYDEQQEEKLRNLVKIYENMKPRDAGRIFEELEMDVLLEVAEKMNKRRLAPILAKMDPKKARDVTEELFRLRSLPQPGQLNGG